MICTPTTASSQLNGEAGITPVPDDHCLITAQWRGITPVHGGHCLLTAQYGDARTSLPYCTSAAPTVRALRPPQVPRDEVTNHLSSLSPITYFKIVVQLVFN